MRPLLRIAVLGLSAAAIVAADRFLRCERSRRRRARLYREYEEAAADPAYQAEMEELERAFDVTVGDGLDEDGPFASAPAR
jgi:hypothetical protein